MDFRYLLIPLISLFVFSFFLVLFIIKQKKRYKELKKLQDIELRKRFETEYNTLVKEQKEGIKRLEKEKQTLQREINEKEEFNKTLFRLREDELNRLIEEKKKEKLAALAQWAQKKKEEQVQRIADEFTEFMLRQDELKKKYSAEVNEIKAELDSFSEKREAVNAAILRERELEEKEDFFRIVVPKEDQEDIEVFETIAPRLRNKEALNKLIFNVYIQRPMDEMIKRVTGGRDISGIYKITYLKTGEAYIGKTTSIKKRWGEHVKSSLDIGTIAHSSFHNRLKKDGLWNYTFEILEEVSKENLTEREKFYIKLYGTDTQLNMKVG